MIDPALDARVAVALLAWDSEDIEVKTRGLRELLALVKEDIQDPDPFRICAAYLLESHPVDAWSLLLHCIVRWTSLYDEYDEFNRDQKYSIGFNYTMKVGMKLKDIEDYESATECFMWAMRYEYGLMGRDGTLMETFSKPSLGFAAYECAEMVDDDPHGPKSREVADLREELLS